MIDLRRYRVISFDCYGTLVDWERGIRGYFERLAASQGRPADAAALFDAYVRVEARLEAGPYRPYRQIVDEAARQVAREAGWPEEAVARMGSLAATIPDWPPFQDSAEALERLGAFGRLAVLSNIDRDLLAGTLRRLPVEFDIVVTAEDVRSYKPAEGHFRRCLEIGGHRPEEQLHVAQSVFHDIEPAKRLGLACVWVNRRGEPAERGRRADAVFANLSEMVAALVAGP